MDEAFSSHSLKGLRLIADLCILVGIILFGSGIMLSALGSLFVIIPIAAGAFMIITGYYLDNLQKIAWWAVVIINSLSIVGIFTGILYIIVILNIPLGITDSVSSIISIVLNFLIISYLLRNNVRSFFFEETAS